MSKTLTALGPEFQVNTNSGGNNGISGAQDLPDVAVLPDGRFVVTYQSDYFGSATDTDPIVAIFNANGTTSLAYRDTFNFGAHQKVPAVAARLDGGFGVVFQNDRHANGTVDANGPNITYVPVSAAGAVLSPIAVADFNAGAGHDALQNPAIATLSTGRQVVAFERVWTALTDDDVFLNVVNAAGTETQFSISNPLSVSSDASWQANPAVAAIGNQAIVVYEDGTGTTTASANIKVRIFDGTSNTLAAALTVADHSARLRTADVAAIDDHRYAIVYGDQNDIWARIYDTTSSAFSPEVQIDVTGGFSLNPQVSALPGGGFLVTWAQYNGADYDVRTRLFGSSGNAIGSDFVVTSLTDASQFTPTVAVSGHNVLFAWVDFASRPGDTAAPGVRGRIFAVTDPDLSVTSNGTVNEGTPSGAGGDLAFTISRTATSEAENVFYTLSGTATAGTDYTGVSGVASFAAGQNTVQVHVPINADSTIEFDETVTITLALNPAASATATINNDDLVFIRGTQHGDRIDADHTAKNEPLPSSFDDDISGRRGNDRLSGEGGDDRLHGSKGNDKLEGEDGNDRLEGETGENKLVGGPGGDTFVFDSKLGKGDQSESYAKILDFTEGDKIELSQSVFKKLDLGVLSDAAFGDVGEKATKDTRVTCKANGDVSYDRDGKGPADDVIIAKLVGKPDVDAGDFLVVA